MTRAHLYRPVTDAAGNIRQNAVVRVLLPGTTTPIPETLYTANEGTATKPNPGIYNNGVIDFYLDQPRRVRIGVRFGSGQEVFFDDVDVPITGSFRAQDISVASNADISSTNVQAALQELYGDIVALDDQALRLPLSGGMAIYQPADPPYLTSGTPHGVNWLDEPEPFIDGGDLLWEKLTGRWVVNTTGYYSFSASVVLTEFTASAGIQACAEARLYGGPRVPEVALTAVVPPNATAIRMSATLQTALFEAGTKIELRYLHAYFTTGAPRLHRVFFGASRVGLIEGVGTPGGVEVETLVFPGADTFPSSTLYPRAYAPLSGSA